MRFLDATRRDIFYALRTLSKRPVFAITAVLTLALAIGGNTAMFTVIRAVLLKPLAYPDSDRLVLLSGGATPARFAEMRASAHSFTGIGAYTPEGTTTLSGGAEPEVLKSVRVSANFLRILGVAPLLGRSFRPEEDLPGGVPVAMISTRLWRQRLTGDPHVVGKTVTLSGRPCTIIGVLPPHFSFPFPDLDVWMTAPAGWSLMPSKSRALSPYLSIFGRLKAGISLAQATAENILIQHRYAIAHPAMLDAKPKKPAKVTPMKDVLVTPVRSMLWMLFGAVGFVLMIACANVAGLLLARAASRSREMAVRSALGATRMRIAGQLIAESVVLSISGGVLGVLLANWAVRTIPGITAFDLPRTQEIHLDGMVLGFAAGLSIVTGVLFGMAPALSASRFDPIRVLGASGEAANYGAPRRVFAGLNLRGLLLVGQVALSVVLFIGTALLIQSVSRLRGVAVGFNPANVLTARISLAGSRYTDKKKALFIRELVQRLRSLPGVRSAAASMFLPMAGFAGTPVQDAAKPLLRLNQRPIMVVSVVTPGYFHTLEIAFRRGRDFTEGDKKGAPRVAIIDEALARRFWPNYPRGQDPVGQHIWIGGVHSKPAEIVGIASDIHQNLENTSWRGAVYVPFAQNPQPFAMLAVRTETKPLSFAEAIRKQVQQLDAGEPISGVRTMNGLMDEQVGQRRLLAILLGSFASMALLLVLVGIYGIIAYSVAQRTQEMGVRRALGAQQGDILRLVMGQSFRLVLAGVAIGIAGAFALTRLMQSLLFHISATDPATFVGAALLFVCVALVASYIPARRATRIDPIAALRI
ncbi:MAG TPA: ABC transporter permease [Bryobacteraceae bacterium]